MMRFMKEYVRSTEHKPVSNSVRREQSSRSHYISARLLQCIQHFCCNGQTEIGDQKLWNVH